MCGLCGAFRGERHWTDGAAPSASRSDLQHRVGAANAVLGVYGLQLRLWAGRYVLTARTGKSAVIESLGELWTVAEAVSGRSCDPLDPAFIAAIERRS